MAVFRPAPFRQAGFAYHAVAAVLIAICIVAAAAVIRSISNIVAFDVDFVAFFCGAKTLLGQHNPYLYEPLHTCEVAMLPGLFHRFVNLVIPAPLPPYALAAFVPLALLPFSVARGVWALTLCISVGVTAWSMSRILEIRWPLALAGTGVAIAGTALLQGELAPLPIALLCAGAALLKEARFAPAAFALTAAMIEPHLALPACIAACIAVPRMRLPLAIGAAICLAISLAALPWSVIVEYFARVLPLHALSEIDNTGQYSLSTLAHRLGVPAPAAAKLGFAEYLLACTAGIWLAIRLAAKECDLSYLILASTACAVIGGSFIHLSQIAMAAPFALAVAVRRPSYIAWAALSLLAIPWDSVLNWYALAPFAALALVFLLWYFVKAQAAAASLAAAGFLVLAYLGSKWAQIGSVPAGTRFHFPVTAPNDLAEVSWVHYNTAIAFPPTWWLTHALTGAGLLAMLGTALWWAAANGKHAENPAVIAR